MKALRFHAIKELWVEDVDENRAGVNVAIECVGNEKVLATMDSVGRRGTLVQVGPPTRGTAIDLHKPVAVLSRRPSPHRT